MLINAADTITPENENKGPKIGKIVDNNDPTKKGKVKVLIEGSLEHSTADLPWIYPILPTFLGGSNNSVCFSVPEVDSYVLVTFPYGEDGVGFYQGHWITDAQKMTRFDQNYPNSYGFEDSVGNWFRVNKTSGVVELQHHSGSYIQFLNNGDIKIHSARNLTLEAVGDILSNSVNNETTASGIITHA